MTANGYGVGYRAADYGNTTTAATLLTMDAAGNVSNKGIERMADVDMFSFSTSGGPVNLTFNPNVFILRLIFWLPYTTQYPNVKRREAELKSNIEPVFFSTTL